MAWVLVKRPENLYEKIDWLKFQTLLLCDGKTEMGNTHYMTDGMRAILKNLEKEGIVEACEHKDSLEMDQYYRYYDNRFVESIFWSITGRCNFHCRHCYMDAPNGVLGELSSDQMINLIDQMAECGVLQVNITGGEPLVRRDFWQLVDRILNYKMTIGQIYTNGWLITDTFLSELEKRNLKPQINVSFDGIGWHDWIRNVKGAEERVLQAIKLCCGQGFKVSVSMCIHKGNQNTLRKTVKMLSNIGVSSIKTSNISKTSLWQRNSEGNALDTREYTEAMIRYIPCFFEDGMPINIMLTGVISLYKGSKDYRIISEKYDGSEKCLEHVLCGAARYTCYITPEGRLLPCMPMTACEGQRKFPLIQDIGLRQGLSDSFYMKIVDSRVKDLLKANSKCASCEHKYQCGGGCRAVALEQTGDLMGCDVNECLLWKEGYVEQIREMAEAAIIKYCGDTVEAQ